MKNVLPPVLKAGSSGSYKEDCRCERKFLDFDGQDENPLVFKTTLEEIEKYVSFKNPPPQEFLRPFQDYL